jgi:two-component system phosphate regulon response regulator PhoB
VTAAAPAAAPSGAASAPITGTFPPDARGRRPSVLVVEDLAHIRRIIAFELDRAGLEVYEAASGREGLDLLENLQVDAVVLDVMMPGIDGMQVCREIRNHPALGKLPILMLTARTRSDAIAQMLAAGATDYLFKPYKREQLIDKVHAVLRRVSHG